MFTRKRRYVVMFSCFEAPDPVMCNVYIKAYNKDDAIERAKLKLISNSIYLVNLYEIYVEVVG